MIDRPDHILTEGWGHIAWVIASAGIAVAAVLFYAKKWSNRLSATTYLLAILVPAATFGSLTVLFSLIGLSLTQSFNGRPRIEYFDNGFCHYDRDGSNRFIRWTEMSDLTACTYPTRNERGGKCSNGAKPNRSAPSFNRSFHAAQFTLKNCNGENCILLIDSMYQSGFVDDLASRIRKAADTPGPDRVCRTLEPFSLKR